ncbi:class D sortase [Clostridium sp.]|uniref:sortase n=1 Tax=Clostridium sp. TaxID=1506 RepID=UPI001B60B33C|nr:class D sortase [Clostridium sp.]MBP3915274.1 class D sortase [Clostridium sp.]
MKKIIRYIGILLIIISITSLGIISYRKYKTYKLQQDMIALFNEIPSSNVNYNNTDYNSDTEIYYNDIDENTNEKSLLEEYQDYNPIAIIEIPSINVQQVLMEGVDDSTLQYFLGHMNGTALPGENGNMAIAGHCYSDYASVFENLYMLQYGDSINVITKTDMYVYTVTDNFTVYPDETYVLDDTTEPTITLITCTPSTTQRVIIKGYLSEKIRID